MKIKIVSDGTTYNTCIYDVQSGKEIKDIVALKWEFDCRTKRAQCLMTIVVELPEIEIEGEVKVKMEKIPRFQGPTRGP